MSRPEEKQFPLNAVTGGWGGTKLMDIYMGKESGSGELVWGAPSSLGGGDPKAVFPLLNSSTQINSEEDTTRWTE